MKTSGKANINTPFEHTLHEKVPSSNSGNPGVFDHHTTPILSKPHSMGKDTISEKFFEGGKALSPNPEKFETPFNNTIYSKGAKKQGMNSGPLDKSGG
jgi:hypothetical protein